MTINKNSEVPLYEQLKSYIQEEISKGNLRPGSRVESETEISEKFQISRITVRKAYGELVDEGYLVRKRGKGTFLRDVRYRESLKSSSFTNCCKSLGLEPSSKVVSSGRIKVDPKIAAALRVDADAEVPYVERLRMADGIPVRLERNYYVEKYADIIHENLEGSIYILLRSKFGLVATNPISFIIEIGYTDKRESQLLGTKYHAPMLKANGTLYDNMGEPVYHTVMMHLPDRCVLAV